MLPLFTLTYRMFTGAQRREAHTLEMAIWEYEQLREAGAAEIGIFDQERRPLTIDVLRTQASGSK
ncbi:hypothetical protein [Devosia sp. A16]|uniref:hypothetical protein n=1 Tax=Devosia sp. A16 TaxID=1736675 RepID=UPI0006D83CBE|nr:hypothetical protein [Devosia sp. A16]